MSDAKDETTIGVISDTHGLLRPEVVEALRGVELILHAGDVGGADVLESLREIAPVHAVRGNVDVTAFGMTLPETETIECGGRLIHMLHILEELDVDPQTAEISAVIYGHTHKPACEYRGDVLYLNPGSIGPRRFSLPVSLALLKVSSDGMHVEEIELDV